MKKRKEVALNIRVQEALVLEIDRITQGMNAINIEAFGGETPRLSRSATIRYLLSRATAELRMPWEKEG